MWEYAKEKSAKESKQQDTDFSDLDLNIPFNDDDLNDPDLLAELAAMTVDDARKPKPKEKTQQKVVDVAEVEVDHILSQIPPSESDDVQVEFKEEDMNDPDLLAQLAIFGRDVEQKEQYEIQHRDFEDAESVNDHITINLVNEGHTSLAIASKIAQLSISESESESRELKLKLTNIDALEQHIKLEKIQALNKKRAGDRQSALDHIQFSKKLQARIDQLKLEERENSAKSPLKTPRRSHEVELGSPDKIVPTFDSMVDKMEKRVKEFKKAALDYKRAGKMNKAREMLGVSKNIQSELENMASGLGNPEYVLPESPNIETESKRQSNESSSPIQVNEVLKVSEKTGSSKPDHDYLEDKKVSFPESTIELITHLIATLDTQMALLTKLAAQCFVSNEKDKALEYHKKKKGMAQDKETLKALKNVEIDSKSMPFSFKYTTFEYSINQTYPDVPLDEINIKIQKAKDIILKSVPDIETLVVFDLGWPNNNQPTLPVGKGETEIRFGSDPVYDYSQSVKIERTKSFQRFLERKKAVFEVFYLQKSMFGMMVKRILFGKVVVKLDDLLTKREIHGMMSIVDPVNPRKNTGAMLEVHLRLRAPLIKADIITTSEKWLLISFGEKSNMVESSPINLNKKNEITESRVTSTKIIESPPKPSTPNQKSPVLPAKSIQSDAVMELESVFQNPDSIVSNQVLEHEHTQICSQILSKKFGGAELEELNDKKQGYEIKMNMLVTNIQLGILTLPAYLQQVKGAIVNAKAQALEFKKLGRLDLAKQALIRVKLMTQEVAEAEASL